MKAGLATTPSEYPYSAAFMPHCTPTSRSGLGCVAPFGALGDLVGNVPSVPRFPACGSNN